MGKKSRKFILAGLIAALVLSGFVGWMWGGEMKLAASRKAELLEASKEYRSFKHEVLSPLKREAAELRIRLEEARRLGDAQGVKRTETELAASLAELKKAEGEAARLHENKVRAEAAFRGASAAWYGFYRITGFSGKLFLNLLNLLVIPLVVSSLVTGMVSLGDIRHVGRTGLRTVIYYLATTSIAVIVGIVLVEVISPGSGVEGASAVAGSVQGKEEMGILDTVLRVFVDEHDGARGAFPRNIVKAMAEMNVLGVIVFSMLFGAALTTVGERASTVISFFEGLNEVILRLVHWVLHLLPVGVFGLVVERLTDVGGGAAVWKEVTRLGWYGATVTSGLAIHGVVVLPLILFIFTGRNPLRYAAGMLRALLTAFATASSSATLPTTMECVEEENRVSRRASSFVLPLGATINMDGTALYEAVAAIFIAQVYSIPMDATMLVIVFLTATLAAVGAAGIPEAGLVTMVMVLNATGLPLEGIAILLSIDWLLDRFRTTVNVWGDSVGAAVVDSFEARESGGTAQ